MIICPNKMRFGRPFTKMVGHFDLLQYMKHTTNAKHKPLGGLGAYPQKIFEI